MNGFGRSVRCEVGTRGDGPEMSVACGVEKRGGNGANFLVPAKRGALLFGFFNFYVGPLCIGKMCRPLGIG